MQARLSALKVLREFYNRLGDEFVILLPETIPFLAEVLEGARPGLRGGRGWPRQQTEKKLTRPTWCSGAGACACAGRADEEPEVVQLCQAVVEVIEHYVGEPLQKYFQ